RVDPWERGTHVVVTARQRARCRQLERPAPERLGVEVDRQRRRAAVTVLPHSGCIVNDGGWILKPSSPPPPRLVAGQRYCRCLCRQRQGAEQVPRAVARRVPFPGDCPPRAPSYGALRAARHCGSRCSTGGGWDNEAGPG